ncbi:MAG: YggS family pyridoxal phosphate-dependent enzyme [Planctomycetota bacterium]|nr:MAG: YggS family pyridoxal phosphate-dependent enzyme [Planctomycetota bacterium]
MATIEFPVNSLGKSVHERLRQNIDEIRGRLADAAARARRDAAGITVVIVTKTVGVDVVRALIELGEKDFGENRIQSALPKIAEVGPGPTWHMIGHLQRNKVRKALADFAVLHAVDSVKLAAAVDRIAGETGRVVPVFLEVNVSGEGTKQGFEASAIMEEFENRLQLRHLDLRGLMTMAPYSDDPEDSRPYFSKLRDLRDRIRTETGLAMPDLSMGMSGDYEVAVEEGATCLRIGTAFFEDV